MNNFKSEFEDFLKTDPIPVPHHLSASLQKRIAEDLQYASKPFSRILGKYFLLQFSSGVLTLAICPQFGIGPIGGDNGISHYFMPYGVWACALFCAAFYFTLSHLFAFYFLSKNDVKRISQNKVWALPIITAATFFILMLTGLSVSNSKMFFTFEFQLTWILSGFILTQVLFGVRSLFTAPYTLNPK